MIAHYYDQEQLRSWILQFANIFTGLKVKTGKGGPDGDSVFVPVPIIYGQRSTVVNSIMHSHTQNKAVFLPMMSCYMQAVEMDTSRRVGTGVVHRQTMVPAGGVFPDDLKVVYRQRPIPYEMIMELAIFSESSRHMTNILEQLLLIFDPMLQIQSNDAALDWAKLTQVELTQIGNEETYPLGSEPELSTWTLTFRVPIWLTGNAEIRDNIVDEIITRITTGNDMKDFDSFDDLVAKNKNDALANCPGCMADGASIVRVSEMQ